MKYIIVLGDGMADEPLEELGGRTPLACAHTPHMDRLSALGEVGLVKTIPEGMAREAIRPICPCWVTTQGCITPAGLRWRL